MKKTIITCILIVAVASMILPVLGTEPVHTVGTPAVVAPAIGTSAVVTVSSGSPPIVKAKWETTNINGVYSYLDDDMVSAGIQVNPQLYGDKMVYYFAVVTNAPLTGITNVYADVKHPDGTVKYQIPLPNYFGETDALTYWENIHTYNPTIVTYNEGALYNYSEIHEELRQGIARIYYGQAKLSYCQPAGLYTVDDIAYNTFSLTGHLVNHFWYVPTVGVDYDFTAVVYNHWNNVLLGAWNQLDGDYNFVPSPAPGDYHPTVRVTGNVPVYFNITQDDMGFNKTAGLWNVHYKARLGPISATWVQYDPYVHAVIPGHLPLCTTEKLDFQILPDKFWNGATSYTGHMTIWALQYGSPETPYASPDYVPYPLPNGWLP
jgi:hypothetical protein